MGTCGAKQLQDEKITWTRRKRPSQMERLKHFRKLLIAGYCFKLPKELQNIIYIYSQTCDIWSTSNEFSETSLDKTQIKYKTGIIFGLKFAWIRQFTQYSSRRLSVTAWTVYISKYKANSITPGIYVGLTPYSAAHYDMYTKTHIKNKYLTFIPWVDKTSGILQLQLQHSSLIEIFKNGEVYAQISVAPKYVANCDVHLALWSLDDLSLTFL